MLSRRNTRIKILQSLYAYDKDDELTFKGARENYKELTINTFNLYLYALYTLVEFCKVSVEDYDKRQEKYLPTEEDKNFRPILFENDAVQSIYRNESYKVKCEKERFADKIDRNVLRRLYREFSTRKNYQEYLLRNNELADHVKILHGIVRFLKNENTFLEMLDNGYANWIDDDSLVLGGLKRTLKQLPADESFFMEYYPSKETTKDFGETLLVKVEENKESIEGIIKPVLNNWDINRLASVDSIILKMAVAELLYFKEIPASVTVNEYAELARMYSTEKSKKFINGILNKVTADLCKKGVIDKQL